MRSPVLKLLTFTATLLLGRSAVLAQVDTHYYPETGHFLDSRFQAFYDSLGGPDTLGHPISESFEDSESGRVVQYLENVRLEIDPAPIGIRGRARLGALGELLGGWEAPVAPDPFPFGLIDGCRFYQDSGHSICDAFLDTYDDLGGTEALGYPISERHTTRERTEQYLQRARLEWYPELGTGGEVRLGPLGREYLARSGLGGDVVEPRLPQGEGAYRVERLAPTVSIEQPVVGVDEPQILYAVVRDQNGFRVSGAAVTVVIRTPAGERTLVMPVTDDGGISRLAVSHPGLAPGDRVYLEFWIVFAGLKATLRDSYMIGR